jgi:hypothetical protein
LSRSKQVILALQSAHVAQQRTDQRPVDQHYSRRIRRHDVLLELGQASRGLRLAENRLRPLAARAAPCDDGIAVAVGQAGEASTFGLRKGICGLQFLDPLLQFLDAVGRLVEQVGVDDRVAAVMRPQVFDQRAIRARAR